MQTGQRGQTPVSPMNRTGRIFQEQQREQEARKHGGDLDVAAIRKEARLAGFHQGFDAGANWAFETMANAGINVEEVLALDDGDQDDDAGEPAGGE